MVNNLSCDISMSNVGNNAGNKWLLLLKKNCAALEDGRDGAMKRMREDLETQILS